MGQLPLKILLRWEINSGLAEEELVKFFKNSSKPRKLYKLRHIALNILKRYHRLRLWGRSCSNCCFYKRQEDTVLIGVTNVRKHAILSPFSPSWKHRIRIPGQSTPHAANSALAMTKFQPEFIGSINLSRGPACFPPANRPVERSKFFSAVLPCINSRNCGVFLKP